MNESNNKNRRKLKLAWTEWKVNWNLRKKIQWVFSLFNVRCVNDLPILLEFGILKLDGRRRPKRERAKMRWWRGANTHRWMWMKHHFQINFKASMNKTQNRNRKLKLTLKFGCLFVWHLMKNGLRNHQNQKYNARTQSHTYSSIICFCATKSKCFETRRRRKWRRWRREVKRLVEM